MVETQFHIRVLGHSSRISLLVFAAILTFLTVTVASTAAPAAENPVEDARIYQSGKKLLFEINTVDQVALRKLERQPDMARPAARYLCFEMTRDGSKLISRICLGGKKNSHHRIGITRTNRTGKVYSKDTIAAKVVRASATKFVFSTDAETARLKPDGYAWRVVASDGTCQGEDLNCRTTFPRHHLAKYRIRPLVMTGCTGGDGEFVTHGRRGRKQVALTFDDGPSLYTPQVLRILKTHDVKATFFMVGTEVERYPDTARRILKQGHELANHSTRHLSLPSAADMRQTSSIIKRTTGFRPCLFRPPGGAVNSSVKAGARAAKMKVVNWDIDTNDWRLPGSGSIYNSITSARSGSIVLMHDGGGPRSQTVGALSDGIERLQDRGYNLVTVTEVLGNEFRYQPK